MKVDIGRSENDCLDCPVGFFSKVSSINCDNCQIGKYSSIISSSECNPCEEGKYTDEINTISCKTVQKIQNLIYFSIIVNVFLVHILF